jgi:glycosyltransferase involved in cell wall biosynthesis
MNVLFVSKERPGRFGPLARALARLSGWRCEFLCDAKSEPIERVSVISYLPEKVLGGRVHYLTRLFDQQVRDAEAIYDAARSSCRHTPDIVVDAAATGSSLPLRDLFRCPVVSYFPFFHQPGKAAPHTRARQQLSEEEQLRLRTANAAALLDLVNCDCGLTSSQFQHSLLPVEFSHKVRVLFEGCDVQTFRRRSDTPRVLGRKKIAESTRIVTYLASRLNSGNGFETFVETAQEIVRRYPDVVFAVCGADVPASPIAGQPAESAKERFLRENKAIAAKFIFIERLRDDELARVLSITDLALHLTVPSAPLPAFIAALACECVVLGSDCAPVREFIRHRQNGLLAGFYSTMALADEAVRVLQSPADYRVFGARARAFVVEHLSLKKTVPRFQRLLLSAGERLPDQFFDEQVNLEAQEESTTNGG